MDRSQSPLEDRVSRALVHRPTCAMVLLDADLRILWASPAVTRLTGFAPTELLQRQAIDFLHPDDLAGTAARLDREVRRSATAVAHPVAHVVRLRSAWDIWVTVEVAGFNLFDDPDVAGLALVLHDVSRRVALDEAVAGLVDHAPSALTLARLARSVAAALRPPRRALLVWRTAGDRTWRGVSISGAPGAAGGEGLGPATAIGPALAGVAARVLAVGHVAGEATSVSLPAPLLPVGRRGAVFAIDGPAAGAPWGWLVVVSGARSLDTGERRAARLAVRLARLALDRAG